MKIFSIQLSSWTALLNKFKQRCSISDKLPSIMGCNSSKTLEMDAHYEAELRTTFKEISGLLPELCRFFVPVSELHHSSALTIGHVPELKKVISKNPKLLYFLKEYFKNNVNTLKFLAELKRCHAKPPDCKAIIHEALRSFEEEEEQYRNMTKKKNYSTTISKLKDLKTIAERDEFPSLLTKEYFTRASQHHNDMVSQLQRREHKLDKKLRLVKKWRKVWSVACGAAFVAGLICPVVLAAMGASHVAIATATAASMAVKSVEQWLDVLFAKREKEFAAEREVVRKICMDNFFVIHEMNSVMVLIERVLNHMSSLSRDVGLTSGNEEAAVKVSMEELKRNFGEFSESVDNLGKEVDFFTKEMGRVLDEILKIIVK